MIHQTLSWPGMTPSLLCQLDTNTRDARSWAWSTRWLEWIMLYRSGQVVFAPVDVGFDLRDEVMDDLNGDGVPDLVFIDAETRTLWTILVRTSDGYDVLGQLPPGTPFDLARLAAAPGSPIKFLPPIALPDRPDSLLTGDFNGDGIPDIAIGYGNEGKVEVQLGVGDGSFLPGCHLARGPHRSGPGRRDEQWGKGCGRSRPRRAAASSPSPGRLAGPIRPRHRVKPGHRAPAIRDMAVFRGSSVGYGAAALTSQGSDLMIFNLGSPGIPTQIIRLPSGFLATRVIAGDIDGDGHDDLVVLAQGTDQAMVLYQGRGGRFEAAAFLLDTGSGPSDATVAYLHGNPLGSIVLTDQVSGDVTIIPAMPGRTFGGPRIPAESGPRPPPSPPDSSSGRPRTTRSPSSPPPSTDGSAPTWSSWTEELIGSACSSRRRPGAWPTPAWS